MKHLFFAALICIAAPSLAQDAKPAAQAASTPALHQVTGRLLALDGKTAWSGRLIRVTPSGKKQTFAVMTDRTGSFTLPKLHAGSYVVRVGSLERVVVVVDGKKSQPLMILASRDVLEAEVLPLGQTAVAESGGTFAIVVGGVIVASGLTAGGAALWLKQDRQNRNSKRRNESVRSPSTP